MREDSSYYNVTIFDQLADRYDRWFERYQTVFQSEINALRRVLPEEGPGVEVGAGTGRFAQVLGAKVALDPSLGMLSFAIRRGLSALLGDGEFLPFRDNSFRWVLFSTAICFLSGIHQAFREAYRVLIDKGVIIVGFINGSSSLGRDYFERQKSRSPFFTQASLYTAESLLKSLERVGFQDIEAYQTLFGELDSISEPQESEPGWDKGIFGVVKGVKK